MALTSNGALQPRPSSPQSSKRRNRGALERGDTGGPPTAQHQQGQYTSLANPGALLYPSSSGGLDPQGSGSSQFYESGTSGYNKGKQPQLQPAAPPIGMGISSGTASAHQQQFMSQGSDASFEGIPLYSSDLSKPFPLFNEVTDDSLYAGYGSTSWKQQLDELHTMWEQTTSGQSLASGSGLPQQNMAAAESSFRDLLELTGFGPQAGSSSAISATSGSHGGSMGGTTVPLQRTFSVFSLSDMFLVTHAGCDPPAEGPMFGLGDSVLDPQGAALWVDVPATYK